MSDPDQRERRREEVRSTYTAIPMVAPNGSTVDAHPSEVRDRIAEGYQPANADETYHFAITDGSEIEPVPVRGADLANFFADMGRQNIQVVALTRGERADLWEREGLEQRQRDLNDPVHTVARGVMTGLGVVPTDEANNALSNEIDAQHPGLAVGSTLLGAMAPTLLSGGMNMLAGASGVGRLASAASAMRIAGPIGIAEALGEGSALAARAGAIGLRRAGVIGSRAARLLYGGSRLAGSVAEGAVGESLLAMTLAAAQNKQLTAEEIFSNAGIGGAIGFGFGAASTFASRAARFATHSPGAQLVNEARILAATGEDATGVAARMVRGELQAPRAAAAEMAAHLAGAGPDQLGRIRRAAQPAYQAAVDQALESLPEFGNRLARHLDDITPAANAFRNEVRAGAHVARLNFAAAANAADVARGVRAPLMGVRDELQAVVREAERFGSAGLPQARSALDAVEAVLGAVRSPGAGGGLVSPQGAAEVYRDLLRAQGVVADAAEGATKEMRMHLERARDVVGDLVGSKQLFGDAAQQHAALALAARNSGDVLDAVRKAAGEVELVEAGARRFSGQKLANALGDAAKSEDTFAAIDGAADALDAARRMADDFGLSSRESLRSSSTAMREALSGSADRSAVLRDFMKGQRDELMTAGLGRQLAFSAAPLVSGALRTGVGAIAGYALGEATGNSGLGAAAGSALGFASLGLLTRPFQFTRQMYQLRQIFRTTGERMASLSSAAKKVINQSGRLITPVAVARPTRAITAFESWNSYDDLKTQYDAVTAELDALRDGGQALIRRISEQSQTLAKLDPELAETFQATSIKALMYLDANRPQQPFDPLGVGEPTPLSMSAMESFVLRFRAVDDPLVLLEDFAQGTLRSETVEAVRFVAPEMYAAMSAELANAVAEARGNVSYQVRLQLATWFDVPEQSLEPSFIAAMQSQGYQTEQQARATKSASAFGRQRNTIATRDSSATERLGQ